MAINSKSEGEIPERNNEFISFNGYTNNIKERKWKLSRDVTVRFDWVGKFLNHKISNSFILLLKHYAINRSASHTNKLNIFFKHYFKYVKTAFNLSVIESISTEHLISYKSSLDKVHLYYLGTIKGFLKTWYRLQLPGVSEGVINLLNEWSFSGNTTGEAVRTRDPYSGALTELELQGFFSALNNAFKDKKISLTEYALARLSIATGRRPCQIGDLKACDLTKVSADSDASIQYILNFPRRKQRAVEWRGEFKEFALTPELGNILFCLIQENKSNLSLSKNYTDYSDLLPLFPDFEKSKSLPDKIPKVYFTSEYLHRKTHDLTNLLKKISKTLNVLSERTGKPLKVTETRLRRTKGTSAARQGYGVLTIAEMLDHSGIMHAKVYIENVPEFIHKLNGALAMQLAPFAQAFAGKLIKDKEHAKRGGEAESVVRDEYGAVGNCGHYGFCGAFGPIACYTCTNFQPWVHGPHKQLLARLLNDRKRIITETGDETIAAINDRTILAVAEVVKLCEDKIDGVSNE